MHLVSVFPWNCHHSPLYYNNIKCFFYSFSSGKESSFIFFLLFLAKKKMFANLFILKYTKCDIQYICMIKKRHMYTTKLIQSFFSEQNAI